MAASAFEEYPIPFCMAHNLIFAAPVPDPECLAKTFSGCQRLLADATDRARTHIPFLYFISGWKPLWRFKVSGETRAGKAPGRMGDSREREADPWTSRKACLTTEQSAFDDASGCCTMRVCRESARLTAVPLIAALGFSLVTPAFGDDASSGCQTLVQAGATGLAADLKADDATIHQPKSVTKFTCLGNFFNGVGLDVVTSKLNVASLAEAAMGKICSQLSSEWDSLQSSAHCGLSVTGLDTNFNLGLGAGSFALT